jgi:hypothetical protein
VVGLELRVRLGDGEESSERLTEQPFSLGRLRRRLRPLRGGAGLCDVLERLALVRRVALDRLDEVRDQVPPALQLDLDLRPRVVDAVPQPDEPVVEGDENDGRQRQHGEDHERPDHPRDSTLHLG